MNKALISILAMPWILGANFPISKNLAPINPIQAQQKVLPKPQTVPVVSEAYVKNLIGNTFKQMQAQGLLKGEKGDKGDVGNPGATGIPLVLHNQPDFGTVIAANILSAAVLTSQDANFQGDLNVSGEADFVGNVSVATGSIASLNVGSLTSDSGAYLSDGGDWVNASSRELKENLATSTPQDILSKIISLPVYTWNYKSQNASTTHIGSMAEDFYAAFNLGGTDKAISTIDPAGVALVGIQALNQKIESFNISWVLDSIKELGIGLKEGIMQIKELVADFVSAKNLEMGSVDLPIGITIYDRASGQPVCIFSENNILKSESGKCQPGLVAQVSAGQNQITVPDTPDEPSAGTPDSSEQLKPLNN